MAFLCMRAICLPFKASWIYFTVSFRPIEILISIQGTFLPASKAEDLAEMNKHTQLRKCSADIQKAFNDLQSLRREVRMGHVGPHMPAGRSRVSQDVQASLYALQEAQVSVSLQNTGRHAVGIRS